MATRLAGPASAATASTTTRGIDATLGRLLAVAFGNRRRELGSSEGLSFADVSLGLLRPVAQPGIALVRHEPMRQPRQARRSPSAR